MGTASSTPGVKTRSLVSPAADFWLVGGLSGIVFVLLSLVPAPSRPGLMISLPMVALILAFPFNYPHFTYSYLLYYDGFRRRLLSKETEKWSRVRHIIAGIIVPAGMVAFFTTAYVTHDIRYMDVAIILTSFLVGWHYVKQGYGVLITLSLYESVFYASWEKRVLWLNAYAVWLYTWLRTPSFYLFPQEHPTPGAAIFQPPEWLVGSSFYLVCLSSALAGLMLLKHWLWDDKGVSSNAVTGYAAAIYMWTLQQSINVPFLLVVPFFHSIQYLPFVYKFKKSEVAQTPATGADRGEALKKVAGFTVAGIALGALGFNLLPTFLDQQTGPWELSSDLTFFMASFFLFINIHHYFIDSAFWRRDNADVQRNLFQA